MTAHRTIQTAPSTRNGIDLTALFETVEAAKADARTARFQFRVANTWMGGSRSRSTIKGFHGAGQEDETRAAPFALEADQPQALLGQDRAASPLEVLLHALASCMATTLAAQAAARGIDIAAIDSRLEGDLDLRGVLDVAPAVRNGYQRIRVAMRVKSAAPVDTLEDLARYSPVYDVISHSVPVDLAVETY